jgi:hypothetical protein
LHSQIQLNVLSQVSGPGQSFVAHGGLIFPALAFLRIVDVDQPIANSFGSETFVSGLGKKSYGL